jgi:hypothetical protein
VPPGSGPGLESDELGIRRIACGDRRKLLFNRHEFDRRSMARIEWDECPFGLAEELVVLLDSAASLTMIHPAEGLASRSRGQAERGRETLHMVPDRVGQRLDVKEERLPGSALPRIPSRTVVVIRGADLMA